MQIRADPRFQLGPNGTVLSLGCLTECLAPHSIKATLNFLNALGPMENPVQIATRWSPSSGDREQLIAALQCRRSAIFHSMVEWGNHVLESGTPSARHRDHFISRISASGIPSILYIKPFIPNHTERFTRAFIELALHYKIRHAVIGRFYVTSRYSDVSFLHRNQPQSARFIQAEFPVGPTPPREPSNNMAVAAMVAAFGRAGILTTHHSLDALREIYGQNNRTS